MKKFLWVACFLLTALTGSWAGSNHVIIISIDGLRPEFYLSGTVCPTLMELRATGSYAKSVIAVYPSLTYPGHASIATGVLPARHGVTGNNLFEPPEVEGRGYWFASDLRVPALWDVAHQAGLTVGTVSWPVTAGAKTIDWNLPEFWSSPLGRQEDLVRRYASPNPVLSNIEKTDWDATVLAYAVTTIREHKPNLLLVHFVAPDKAQHHGGRDTPALLDALKLVDGYVADIIAATKAAGTYAQTTFIICGDHGFSNVSSNIMPNVLLAQHGFITQEGKTVTDWQAMVRNTGGSAGVYLKDATQTAAVMELLQKNSQGFYRVVPKAELTQLGGPAEAAFYLEAAPGYMFSGSLNGSNLVRAASLKGNHGYLSDKPEMHTGFIIAGRGIKPGVVLEKIQLVDIAPTAAALLGLRMEKTDGRVLDQFNQDR
ncbi:MAG: hypothetical protein PCFJNLEI_02464 [Verrucomicrobiae bacterium]|nr:hypothetical protein [Verrucomicrobiae bacterium]